MADITDVGDFGESAAVAAILRTTEDPVIVDLGAHEGEDSGRMMSACKNPPVVVLVEADKTNFDVILSKKLEAGARELYTFHAAIASYTGECEFYESRESGGGFGSIYRPIGPMSVDIAKFNKVGPICCFTFDDLFMTCSLDHIDILWTDIHGAEKDMIRFGANALSKTRYLMVEFFDSPIYEGMATRTQLQEMLPGWTVQQEFPWNLLLRNTNYAL